MEKKFTSLFERLSGKEDQLLKNVIAEIKKTEEKEEKIKKEEELIEKPEVEKEEIKEIDLSAIGKIFEFEEAERTTELIREELERVGKEEELMTEFPPVEVLPPEVEAPQQIPEAKVEQKADERIVSPEKPVEEVRAEEEKVEERLQKFYEKSEELLSEEKAYRKITEKVEGKKKVVEGAEDLKRKIIISIDIDEVETQQKTSAAEQHFVEEPLKYVGQNGKINSMEKAKEGAEELGIGGRGGSNIIIQEIINRIRSDIIAKSEIEAKKRIDEAERKAKEIIDNAYKESERIINEAVSRSLDISREIEKEAEEKGYKVGYEKGYKDGLEKGHEEGYKKALSEGRYALELIRKVADEVSYAKEKFSDDFPKIVLHLTLVALKTILMTDFIKDEELIVRVVKDALDKVKDFKIVKIKLNKADIELVKKYFDLPSEIEIISAPDVERGDVKIEMKEGYFESTIKWRERIIEDVLKGELLNLSKEGGSHAKEESGNISGSDDEAAKVEAKGEVEDRKKK